MSEKRFLLDKVEKGNAILSVKITDSVSNDNYFIMTKDFYEDDIDEIVGVLNEQQELIEELHISDHMGWGRAEKFEKELKQKKIYIKRLEYKVQKFKEMNSEQQATIEELRLQEKEKGVPVFVVRDGKNPVALFFNEQRAMYYCQENMAHLTYQQEKWCRVE